MDSGTWVPIFFFLAVFGIVALTLWRRLEVERERQQTIRLAIERGQPLDASLVEKMLAPPPAKAPGNPFTWPIGIASTGIGLGIFSLFMRQLEEDAFWPIMGSGCLVATIGVGLFVSAYMRARFIGGNGSFGPGG